MNFTVRKVFSETIADLSDSIFGILTQSDGSHLFGFSDGYLPQASHWYRSTDQGETWQARGTAFGDVAFAYTRPANCPTDIAVYGTNNENGISAAIYRSADNGNSWTQTGDWPFIPTPGNRTNKIRAITTYQRGNFLAVGQFQSSTAVGPEWLARSQNNGVTWTTEPAWASVSNQDVATAIVAAGDGVMYCAVALRPDIRFETTIYRSTDNGATWTATAALPLPGGAIAWNVITMAAYTKDWIVAGGSIATDPLSNIAGLWWTQDGGATWNRVDKSSVTGWPGGSDFTSVGELKRLTRWIGIVGWDQYSGSSAPLVAATTDGGQTYTLGASSPSSNWPAYGDQHGSIVQTRNGNILIPLWGTDDYSTSRAEVWIGTITA